MFIIYLLKSYLFIKNLSVKNLISSSLSTAIYRGEFSSSRIALSRTLTREISQLSRIDLILHEICCKTQKSQRYVFFYTCANSCLRGETHLFEKKYFSFKANIVGSIKDRKKFFKQKLYGFKSTLKL